ncbi:hypothetical protein LZ31DRAFT_34159 [Colletotrichum somersetense]|nr:hypothetical protein LZ31DRAFT_34159 [Colletotrichum somersetense]
MTRLSSNSWVVGMCVFVGIFGIKIRVPSQRYKTQDGKTKRKTPCAMQPVTQKCFFFSFSPPRVVLGAEV